jgi:tRNA/rRNA methyltransferase
MDESALARIRIVLVEPAGPLNVGSVARVMKNMGLSQLVLVNPQCDRQDEWAVKMAVHGVDILEAAQIVDELPQALIGCQRAIATAGRSRSLPTDLEPPRIALPWLLEAPSALIFGREDRGLSNDELNYAQRFVRIPSSPEYPSLNLAQSVAVCAAELYQQATGVAQESPFIPSPISPNVPTASLDELEGYYQHLEQLLLKIGYLYPHTAARRLEKFRRLYNRAQLSSQEVAMLRGILSQMQWALSQGSDGNDTL